MINIVAFAAVEVIPAFSADQDIHPSAAVKHVVSIAANQIVIAVIAVKRVVAVTAVHIVVARPAKQRIVACNQGGSLIFKNAQIAPQAVISFSSYQ